MAARGPGAGKDAHDGPLDDSLTSLHWLHNLNATTTLPTPTPPVTPEPGEDGCRATQVKVDPNHVLGTSYRRATAAKSEPRSAAAAEAATGSRSLERVDYKTNALVKPPYSYATLICMAMTESKKNKITLAAIYSWIMDNFLYYRLADPSWQNSIRHNLSLNKCFEKVPRQKDEPGKGGFWRISSEYSELLESGIYKRRRGSARDESAAVSHGVGWQRPPTLDDSGHSPTKRMRELDFDDDDESNILSLQDDVNFNSLLGQDIEINGVRLRAEDLLDTSCVVGGGAAAAAAAAAGAGCGGVRSAASSLLEASPPPSESSSDDLDEFLRSNFTRLAADADCAAGSEGGSARKESESGVDALSLSVQGVRIEPPDWWLDSLNSTAFRGLLHSSLNGGAGGGSLPPAAAPSSRPGGAGVAHHPWSADRSELDEAIAALDADALLFN